MVLKKRRDPIATLEPEHGQKLGYDAKTNVLKMEGYGYALVAGLCAALGSVAIKGFGDTFFERWLCGEEDPCRGYLLTVPPLGCFEV